LTIEKPSCTPHQLRKTLARVHHSIRGRWNALYESWMTVRDPFHYFLPAPNALSIFLVLVLLQSLAQITFGHLPIPGSLENVPWSGKVAIYFMFVGCCTTLIGCMLQLPFRFTPVTWRVAGVEIELGSCLPIATGALAYALALKQVAPETGALAFATTLAISVFFLIRFVQIVRALHRIRRAADFLRLRDATAAMT
jgi:hypothetical protein